MRSVEVFFLEKETVACCQHVMKFLAGERERGIEVSYTARQFLYEASHHNYNSCKRNVSQSERGFTLQCVLGEQTFFQMEMNGVSCLS